MAVWDKPVSRIHHSQEQLYFPSPYATSRISMYSGDGDTEGRTTPCWPPPNLDDEDHTYDVPFRNKQNSTTNRRREQESDTSRYRSKERHLYINPGNVTMPVEKCIGNQGHAGNRNTTVDSSGGQLCMFLQSPTRVRLSEGSYDKIRRQEQSRMRKIFQQEF
ncbi:uncharacterized protein LOC143246799 isoform X2 [Tachypleus tridentatus]|uniref:uncharacterized protein LOC143246799 isoform X2 n=1 Tax=Tachypleus tridentatus TaxID=6853 RepID=UPI003FD1E286